MQAQSTQFIRFGKGNPCPICGRMTKCSRTHDGLFMCWETRVSTTDYRHLGEPNGTASHLFRKVGDPLLRQTTSEDAASPQETGREEEAKSLLAPICWHGQRSTPGRAT